MRLRSWSVLAILTSLSAVACDGVTLGGPSSDPDVTSPADEVVDESVIAGANQNDRSVAVQGEDLRTGAMVVSQGGRYIVMQRNTQTVLFDASTRLYHELAAQVSRVAFAHGSETVFTYGPGGALTALDLASRTPRWSVVVPGSGGSGSSGSGGSGGSATLLRVTDDDATLLLGDGTSVHVVDARSGATRRTYPVSSRVTHAAFVPGQPRALVVGATVWRDGGPHTPVQQIDLTGLRAEVPAVDVPNCEAPIAVTPDGQRAFLSPTYCSPGSSGAQPTPGQTWTNPDPVSVIELAGGALSFVKNLPGFGPVAMSSDGRRVLAYLDVARMDAAMFDDPAQVPWKDGQRYHLMTIDPVTLRFQLAPIGNAIPRFALTADGRGVLVDASSKASSRTKIAARASIEIGSDGVRASAEVNLDVFGSSAAFGYFDLASQSFTPFSGPRAPLDRFVQLAGGRYVVSLERLPDGTGAPHLIDLTSRVTMRLAGNYQRGVRDVGLADGGARAFVRVRLPAVIHDGGYYGRESLCISSDGSCGATFDATYEATTPFAPVPPPPPAEPARDPYLDCPDRSEC